MSIRPSNALREYMYKDAVVRNQVRSLLDEPKPDWAATDDNLHYTFICNGKRFIYVVDIEGLDTVINIDFAPE